MSMTQRERLAGATERSADGPAGGTLGISRRTVLAGGLIGAVGAAMPSLVSAGTAAAANLTEDRTGLGQPPPEWSRNAAGWPSHNYDLSNTRATTSTAIRSVNVARLRPKWRFPLSGGSPFGG